MSYIKSMITCSERYTIDKYIALLRKDEYYRSKKGLIFRILDVIVKRRRNRIGNCIGLHIPNGTTGEGLTICHYNIVINDNARIGNNCKFHGNNCVGNNGIDKKAPIIGDNVDIGFGAIVIGDIEIADGCKISAGAVVNKSCLIPNSILAGVPAKVVKQSN